MYLFLTSLSTLLWFFVLSVGFRSLPYRDAFLMMGCMVIASSFLSAFVNIPLHAGLLHGEDNLTVIQARERYRSHRGDVDASRSSRRGGRTHRVDDGTHRVDGENYQADGGNYIVDVDVDVSSLSSRGERRTPVDDDEANAGSVELGNVANHTEPVGGRSESLDIVSEIEGADTRV
jgi:hypothetical protein